MKLVRNAVTEANPQLRGRKHHFTIEGATEAVLEAMDEALVAEGWDNDTCPIYDEGVSCGYWVDIEEVDYFKKAYKAVKALVKNAQAVEALRVAVEAAEEAAHVETLLTEEAAATVTGATVRVGQVIEDAQGRAFVVTQVMRMAGYTDVSGHVEGTYYPVTHGYRSVRLNTSGNGRFEYGVESVRLVRDIEVTPELVEAAHAEAQDLNHDFDNNTLKNVSPEGFYVWSGKMRQVMLDRAHLLALRMDTQRDAIRSGAWVAEVDTAAHRLQAAFYAANDYSARRAIVEAAHAEALAIEAEALRVAQNDVFELATVIRASHKQRKPRRKPAVTIAAVDNGVYTWRVRIGNRVYLYSDNATSAQQRMPAPVGHTYKDVSAPAVMYLIKKAICDSLPARRRKA